MTDESPKELARAEALLGELALREPDWNALAERIEKGLSAAPRSEAQLFDPPSLAPEDGPEPAKEPLAASAEAGTATTKSEPPPSITVGEATEATVEEVDDGWASAPEAAAARDEASAEAAAASADVESASTAAEPAAPAPTSAPREGVSLAELARASVKRRTGEAASIAKESLAVASQRRGRSEQAPEHAEPAAAAEPQAPRSARAHQADSTRGAWLGVGIATIGLAAGFGLYLAGQRTATPPTVIVTQAPEATPAPEAPLAKAPDPNSVEAPDRTNEEAEQGHAVDSLPLERSAPSTASKPAARPSVAAPGGVAPKVAAEKVAAEKVVLDEEGQAPAPPAKAASSKPGNELRPADDTSAGSTDRPSSGAAQAAVGAVLGAARSCVAGHGTPSTARLVFGSDGQVQSVAVGGPAQGTPAEACIQSALKKARVQPFAAPSFSLGVTVRPP